MLRSLLVLTVISMVLAGSAQASSIRVDVTPGSHADTPSWKVVFTALPGESNTVLAARTTDGWVVRDSGAALTPGGSCVAVDANAAHCSVPPDNYETPIEITLGDGNDVARMPESLIGGVIVHGDAGDDTISGDGTFFGDDGHDKLTGGRENDVLVGGPGRDELHGGDGIDELAGDGMDGGGDAGRYSDTLDGGAGSDIASYSARRTSIRADLALHLIEGAGGERDVTSSVENVYGGSGADTVLGDDGPNRLTGGAGNDRIYGRGGDDVIFDGTGRDVAAGGTGNDEMYAYNAADRLTGGPGDDKLSTSTYGAYVDGGSGDDKIALHGNPARLICGSGSDTISSVKLTRTRLDGCDNVSFGVGAEVTVGAKPHRAAGALTLPVSCREKGGEVVTGCVGTIAVRLRGNGARSLGKLKFRTAPGEHSTVQLPLTPRGKRALLGQSHPLLELTVVATGTPTDDVSPPQLTTPAPNFTARWLVRA